MKRAGRKEDLEFGPGELGFRGTCVQNRSPIPSPHLTLIRLCLGQVHVGRILVRPKIVSLSF